VKKQISISKRNLLLFGLPILGLLVGLLGNFAFVAPQKSQARQLDGQLQAAQSQLLVSQRAAAAPKPVKPVKAPKAQSVQAADIFRLSKAMPDSNDMPGILLELSQLAKASAVTLQSVSPAARVPLYGGYAALPVVVVITGKFDHVSGFLQGLRKQAAIATNGRPRVTGRLLVANQVAMTSSDGKTVSATLNLDAFVYGAGLPPVVAVPVGPTGAAGAA
jgi:Tfp pilus assembly protein PilO